jgi:hypothetical protein
MYERLVVDYGESLGCEGIDVDSTHVYTAMLDGFQDGNITIVRTLLDGGALTPLTKSTEGYSNTALVGTSRAIYWASTKVGKVYGLAK